MLCSFENIVAHSLTLTNVSWCIVSLENQHLYPNGVGNKRRCFSFPNKQRLVSDQTQRAGRTACRPRTSILHRRLWFVHHTGSKHVG